MNLSDKVKVALDETRMLILGAQILLGFQLHSSFYELFEDLPAFSRYLNAVALLLMLTTLTALIAPAAYHRIVERGNDSGRLHGYICRMMSIALLPFALSLGIDLFVALSWIGGTKTGIAGGVGGAVLALVAWYGVEHVRANAVGRKERAMSERQRGAVARTPLHTKIDQMLTEARVVLPGAQALLGFQLAIVLTEAFAKLPPHAKAAHAVALGLVALAIVILMAPAAYHRIVYAGEDSADFHRAGSAMVTAATFPLAFGISADVYVVLLKIAHSAALAASLAALVACAFVAVWYVVPVLKRRQAEPAEE